MKKLSDLFRRYGGNGRQQTEPENALASAPHTVPDDIHEAAPSIAVHEAPPDIRELMDAHRFDQGNLQLGFHSISLEGGHAGTDVTYYAALHQVIVHDYAVFDGIRKDRSSYKVIDIPEDITTREEITDYVRRSGCIAAPLL